MAVFTPDTEHERAFRDALGQFTTGVTVVTAPGIAARGGPVGITANSFAALSLEPPLVLWSPARRSSRFEAFAGAEHFAIHVLSAGQMEICRHFTRQGSFEGIEHRLDPQGVPLLPGALARFCCHREAVHEGGDHLLIIGRVVEVETNPGEALVFRAGHFVTAG